MKTRNWFFRLRAIAWAFSPHTEKLPPAKLRWPNWTSQRSWGRGTIPDRISVLSDVAEVVARSHDLTETLANVTRLVAKRLTAEVCSIYLTEPDLKHLRLRATIGLDPASVGQVRLQFGEGLVGLAVRLGETVSAEHASRHPDYQYFPETGEERYESLVAAPMMVQGGIIGVLVIQSAATREFDQQDSVLLQTCAQLLAPVVVNAQLIDLVGRGDAVAQTRAFPLDSGSDRDAREECNVELCGIAAAPGVAIGPIHRLENPVDLAKLDYQPNEDFEEEKRELQNALLGARREIDGMRDIVGTRFGPEFAAVFHTQVQILEDKGFVQALEQRVDEQRNAFSALRSVLAQYRETFERIEDPYFRERGADIEDVGLRVMENLLGVRQRQIPMEPGSVVVVNQILPALFARLEMDKVIAIVAEHGGATSHGAIFARTLEIPAVTGVEGIQAEARANETAIVDGATGRIYLSPDAAMLSEYQRAQHRYAIAVEHLDALRERPAETRDGRRIVLSANVGLLNDLQLVEKHGAEGIGLFRTELLALAHRGFPSEEEQRQLYWRVCDELKDHRVTIRTLDLGGDKGIPNIGIEDEDNPQLGCRSIRLTLENRGSFRTQLRALFRASIHRNVRLLIPMISSVAELRETRELIDEVKFELSGEGHDFDPEMPIGVMIEVPSAALIADALAKECDFFSIGTNDLTQYTLAVDRGNERVAHLYEPMHPAVLTLIDRSVRSAARAQIPVSLCGEIATHPLAVPLMVGLGISELSGTPSAIPVVKEIVRALNFDKVTADARDALSAATAEEVVAIGAARLEEVGLLEHPDIGDWLRTAADLRRSGPQRTSRTRD